MINFEKLFQHMFLNQIKLIKTANFPRLSIILQAFQIILLKEMKNLVL